MTILSLAISSKAIERGLRATEVTCGGTMAPRPSPSWLKYALIWRARIALRVTSENLEPARSNSSSIDGFIIVSWREAMGARTSRSRSGIDRQDYRARARQVVNPPVRRSRSDGATGKRAGTASATRSASSDGDRAAESSTRS